MGKSKQNFGNSEAQKAMAESAARNWADYQNISVPAENKLMRDVEQMDTKNAIDEATSLAQISNTSNTTAAINGVSQSMAANGINPNSTNFKQTVEDVTQRSSAINADTTNKTLVSQQDRYVQGVNSINAIGQGQEATAISGQNDLAQMSHQDSINEFQNKISSNSSNMEIAGVGVGAVTKKLGG